MLVSPCPSPELLISPASCSPPISPIGRLILLPTTSPITSPNSPSAAPPSASISSSPSATSSTTSITSSKASKASAKPSGTSDSLLPFLFFAPKRNTPVVTMKENVGKKAIFQPAKPKSPNTSFISPIAESTTARNVTISNMNLSITSAKSSMIWSNSSVADGMFSGFSSVGTKSSMVTEIAGINFS